MKKVHFEQGEGPACDTGIAASPFYARKDWRLTRDKRLVTCDRCCRTKAYQASKGKDGR